MGRQLRPVGSLSVTVALPTLTYRTLNPSFLVPNPGESQALPNAISGALGDDTSTPSLICFAPGQ